MRIVHIISEFSRHEAMGRSIAETVARVPGEHHLIAARIHDGSAVINVPLSQNRAKSVADFLVAHGIPADHVTAKGLGAADPVASNTTPDGRAQNRRIAIVVS